MQSCYCVTFRPLIYWACLCGFFPAVFTHDKKGRCVPTPKSSLRMISFFWLALSAFPVWMSADYFERMRHKHFFIPYCMTYTYAWWTMTLTVIFICNFSKCLKSAHLLAIIMNTKFMCEASKRKLRLWSYLFVISGQVIWAFFTVVALRTTDDYTFKLTVILFYIQTLVCFLFMAGMTVVLFTNIYSCYLSNLGLEFKASDRFMKSLKSSIYLIGLTSCTDKHVVPYDFSKFTRNRFDIHRIFHTTIHEIFEICNSAISTQLLCVLTILFVNLIFVLFFFTHTLTSTQLDHRVQFTTLTILFSEVIVVIIMFVVLFCFLKQGQESVGIFLFHFANIQNHRCIKIFMNKLHTFPIKTKAGFVAIDIRTIIPLLNSVVLYALVGYSFEIFID